MVDECIANSYEVSRRRRLEENMKRFEDLGIAKISKSLTDLSNPDKRSQPHSSKPKRKTNYTLEPRRSSRAPNTVSSYWDDVDIGFPAVRKRSRSNSSFCVDACRTASYEEKAQVFKVAEEFQSSLQDAIHLLPNQWFPLIFIGGFWLGLPTKFCEDHLSEATTDIVLDDEDGMECGATYIGKRAALSGGWRGFALDHKLDDGDALVFELIQPMRLKVYIFRGKSGEGLAAGAKKEKRNIRKAGLQSSQTQKEEQPTAFLSVQIPADFKPRKKDRSIRRKF